MISRAYTTKIDIWQHTEVPDGFGGYVTEPAFIKRVWAGKKTSGAGFKFQQFGLNDFKNPVIFSIRGKNNIDFTEKTFVIYKGHRYEVKGFENVNLESLEIIIYCDAA